MSEYEGLCQHNIFRNVRVRTNVSFYSIANIDPYNNLVVGLRSDFITFIPQGVIIHFVNSFCKGNF